MELNKSLVFKTCGKALKDNIIYFKGFRFTLLKDNIIRIEKNKVFQDDATLTFPFRNTSKVDYTYTIDNSIINIKTKEVSLFYDTLKDLSENYVIFKGTSEKRPLNNDYNLRGTMRTLDTYHDGGFCVDKNISDFSIESLPLEMGILSKNGVAVIDDKKSPIFRENGLMAEREYEEIDTYLFLYLYDYKKALKDFYDISGKTPLIPRYALGNWWSRYHAYTDKEYLSLLDKFEQEKIPLSVATIDMDWHYVDIDTKFNIEKEHKTDIFYGERGGWTGYTWNSDLFPNYQETLKEIHDRDLYITLNLHPKSGIRWFESMYEDMALSMGIDPKSEKCIEFDMTDPLYINNYFKYVIHPYETDGVDFWWIDYQQERVTKIKDLDPMWPLNHYHSMDQKDQLILSRYAGLGSHRYPLGFSGDTKQIFEFLNFMPYFTFTASNAGYTWWSHDIGAHHYGIKDDDLYIRWIEFGVFSPINRIHANAMNIVSKEPWLTKRPIELIAKEYLRLRHRLVPYIYNYSHLTNEIGLALIRPLYYEEAKSEKAYQDKHSYYFGELVVSPIVDKAKDGYSIKKMYLPKGLYYDLFSKKWYRGGRFISISRDLASIPVMINSNSMLPLQNDISNKIEKALDLELNIVSNNSSFVLNESDEEGSLIDYYNCYKKDNSSILTIKTKTNLIFKRSYSLEFRYLKEGNVTVLVDGKNYKKLIRHGDNLRVLIKDVDIRKDIQVIITNEIQETEREYMIRNLLEEFTRYNAINEEKENMYLDLCQSSNLEELKKKVKKLKVKNYFKTLLNEITLIK